MYIISKATNASEEESDTIPASRIAAPDAVRTSNDGKDARKPKKTIANEPEKLPKDLKNVPEDKSISIATSRTSGSHQVTTGSLMDAGNFFGISTDAASLAAESRCSRSFERDQLNDTFDE